MSERFAVVFDLDGTLIDATEAIIRGFNHALEVHRIPVMGDQQVLRMMGRPLVEMFFETGRRYGVEARLLVESYMEYSRSSRGQGVRLLPGARPLLENCRSFCRVGVNTARTTTSARRILGGLGVNHLLPQIVGLDQVTHPKPHPEGVQLVLSRLGVLPGNSLMLGDTPDDIQAALAAGARAFGVATGYYSSQQLQEAGAFEVFSNLADFDHRLRQLFSSAGKGRTT